LLGAWLLGGLLFGGLLLGAWLLGGLLGDFTLLFVGGGPVFPKGIKLFTDDPFPFLLFPPGKIAFTAPVAASATAFTAPVAAFTTAFIAPTTGFCPAGGAADAFISL
jgi:hypothetical protein